MSDFYFIPVGRLKLSDSAKLCLWRFEAGVIGICLRVFRWLPFWLGRWLAEKIFAILGVWNRRARNAHKNLSVVFADQPPGVVRSRVRRTFGHLGQAMAEMANLDKIWASGRIQFELLPGANRPCRDQPSVFVSAHVGAWELTPLIARYYGLEMPVIYAPERNPFVDARLRRMRRAYQSELVPNRGGLPAFMRALRQGKSVGMTADTQLKGAPELAFFGFDTPTNTGPASLAVRYGVDIVPVLCKRLAGGRYCILIHPPIKAADPDAESSVRIRDITQQLNRLFESWIRDSPGQWLCLKRRWGPATYRELGLIE